MTFFAAVPRSEGRLTIETRASWAVCLTALGIAVVSFAAPAITVVGLKSIAADLGGERSVMNPNHYLAVAVNYLLKHRPDWPMAAAVELLRNLGDGLGQAASGCWLTASMPSM